MTVLSPVERRTRVSWRRRLLWITPLFVLLLVGCAAASFYLYDRSQSDRIGNAVSVGGIEIGGMGAAQARSTLARRLVPRYRRPLVLEFGRRRFRLDPAAAHVHVDVAGAVATALAASRRGSFVRRVWLEPRVRYSSSAVRAFVRRLARQVAERPRDARFVPSLVDPRIVPSRNGLAL